MQVLVMVFLSIAVLISGVVLLSLKSSAKSATDPYTVSARPTSNMRLNPRSRVVSKQSETGEGGDQDEDEERGSPVLPKRDEVMWEVGSVSDDEDADGSKEQPGKPQGLGEGSGRGQGERRGLLDEDELDGDIDGDKGKVGHDRRSDEDEDFGEYEAVGRSSIDDTGGPGLKT
jgi:hypothetical protein